MLVTLARRGVEFGRLLRPLGIPETGTIDLLVNPDTPLLPVELVYVGKAPVASAKLCEHVKAPPPDGHGCKPTSTKTVCPYAFWGLQRTVARTIAWKAADEPRRCRKSVSSSSVLYASTERADQGGGNPKPSDSVQLAADELFQRVTRASTWTAWRRAISDKQPDLLVVLGHTEREEGESGLYIGNDSALMRPDISEDDVRHTNGPVPIVLLVGCATASTGDSFGTFPGALTEKGAGAVIGTLSKITGANGATAAIHLLTQMRRVGQANGSVGDAVLAARRSLLANQQPMGLLLVAHGELDTKVGH
jgi:hypothetical protein